MKGLRVLITGGTGLLGKTLLETASRGMDVAATFFQSLPPGDGCDRFVPLDCRDAAAVARVFDRLRPDVVIHTASIGSVDYAERHREEAWAVNVGGTRHVLDACCRYGTKFTFISSNAVFDGRNPPYSEEDATCPINYYGQLKMEAEEMTTRSGVPYAIVRPILMYGWPNPGERMNPVVSWVQSLEQGRPIKVVDDVYSKPLLVHTCAAVCWAVVENHKTGIYHVAGQDRVTLYEFALETARVFGLDERLISPVPNAHFAEIAPRPKDTSFLTQRIESELGVHPVGIRDGLTYMKDHR